MRVRYLVATVLAAGATGAAVTGAPAQGPVEDLLPDLVQEVPSGLEVSHEGGRQRLAFRSAVHNAGRGPFIIAGSRPSIRVRDMRADQIVTRTHGPARRQLGVGFLRFVPSLDHSHWHFLPFERYELFREGATRRLVRDRKSGFCLGDRYLAQPSITGVVADPVYESRCGLNRRGLLTIREGISVGWGDDYMPFLDDQFIDITGVPTGRYLLVHTVNASGRIAESDRANNVAGVRIALFRTGKRVRVRVLGPVRSVATSLR